MSHPRVTPEDVGLLKELIGPSHVSAGKSVLELHSSDESSHTPSLPDVVVKPQSTEDVQKTVVFAAERGYAVTPRGAGTSVEGNPIPIKGGIVLDLNEMNRIIEIRERDLQVDVEAGVYFRDLNEQLRHYGLFFPPDPGASASIGGMIGNNASGIRTVAYGATRDCVLGLEVVMADGEVAHFGSRAQKSSSGYDMVKLIVGSEGTLGIVTKATLRLTGLPPEHLTATATFDSVHDATNAVCDIMRYGLNPAALELMDESVVAAINRDKGTGLEERPMLFMEFHNVNDAALENQFQLLETLLADHNADNVAKGIGSEARARLWEARHQAFESIRRNHKGMHTLIVDTCVPISRYAEMVDKAAQIVGEEGAIGYFLGHGGDGNLHLILIYDPNDPDSGERAKQVNRRIVNHSIKAGGTCTGEHGVGLGKREFIEAEHGAALRYMKAIKVALDPKGILNPGKKLP